MASTESGWFLEEVEIGAPSLGKKWKFPCRRWMDTKEDDGQVERELYPVKGGFQDQADDGIIVISQTTRLLL
jgi:hypothetical protein